MNNKFKNVLALGGFIIVSIIAVIVMIINQNNDIQVFDSQTTALATSLEESSEIKEDTPHQIVVYILGAVKEPGIVKVNEKTRLYEIISLAGGATEDADLGKVNLASFVQDEQKIIIPYRDVSKKSGNGADIDSSHSVPFVSYSTYEIVSKDVSNENSAENEKEIELIPFDLDYGYEYYQEMDFEDQSTTKININTASVSELIKLKGIGNSTANKIIQYREENGLFHSIEDLKKVNGIGESKFNAVKEDITV